MGPRRPEMWRIKALADPDFMLAGVVLNRDPDPSRT